MFDSNVPDYFALTERRQFEQFLEESTDPYFVLLDPSDIVAACGGIAEEPHAGLYSLTWGMVRRDMQRQGYGSRLVKERLLCIREYRGAWVRIDTSQHTRAFYERHGFFVVGCRPDGYAPGLDKYEMVRPANL